MFYYPFMTTSAVDVEQQAPCLVCDDALALTASGIGRDGRAIGTAFEGNAATDDGEDEDMEYEEFSPQVSGKSMYGVVMFDRRNSAQTGLWKLSKVLRRFVTRAQQVFCERRRKNWNAHTAQMSECIQLVSTSHLF